MTTEITDSSSMETDEILVKVRRTIAANRENLAALDLTLAYGMCQVPSKLPRDSAASMLRLVEELLSRNSRPEEFVEATIQGETDDAQAALHYADAKQEIDEEWRMSFQRQDPSRQTTPPRITDTRGWSDEQVLSRLESVKAKLDWANTTGSAKKWWETFEKENRHRIALVLRLAEEIANRKATVTEFFLAYVYSNTDNIQANLHYLDYTRLKKEEERKKREAARAETEQVEKAKSYALGADDSSSKSDDTQAIEGDLEVDDEDWEGGEGAGHDHMSSSENTELTFVRCQNCRSLVPAVSTRCRMCGVSLNTEDKPADPDVDRESEGSGLEREHANMASKENVFNDRYEILSVAGRGVNSIVYHARHIDGDPKEVALKVLIDRLDQGGGLDNSDRLRAEALALVSSRHKHVIRLDDFHSIGGTHYLVMEYARLGSLNRYAKCTKLTSLQVERFLLQAAEALAFMHKIGMLHCDINPSNMLLIDHQDLRIGDFGNALLPGHKWSLESFRQGVSGLDYLAPEVLESEAYDQRSDLYSLGVSFYELLSGKHPFAATSGGDISGRKKGNFDSISDLETGASENLLFAVEKLMEFEPQDRFQDCRELIDSLSSGTT